MILNIQDDILKLHSLGLLDKLLLDKTTGKRIMWATDAYTALGPRYGRNEEITPELITGPNASVIKTRARKEMEQQSSRTRQHGEVSTPLWVCERMCDYADEMWNSKARWQKYVDARVLEITCGEAPFLVSRYDVESGEAIPIPKRIGLLDRKLQAVNENTRTEEDWLKWVFRAFHATYGYEFQGDNLLIARVNLLMTFEEYLWERWRRKPTLSEYGNLITVIVWNVWQMDGLHGTIPYSTAEEEFRQFSLFEFLDGMSEPDKENKQPRCRVYNWLGGGSVEYSDLPTRGKRAMKFDFIIGNPPYQEETVQEVSKTNGQAPRKNIFHYYQIGADKLAGEAAVLIYPAGRWIHRSGKGMEEFGLQQINDPKLKKVIFYPDSSEVFSGVAIADGVGIVIKDMKKTIPGFEYVYRKKCSETSVMLECPGSELIPLNPSDLIITQRVNAFVHSNNLKYLHERILPRSLFGIESSFVQENPEKATTLEATSSVDYSKQIKLFTNDKAGKAGRAKWFVVDRSTITSNIQFLDEWQVVVSSANAGGQKRDNQLEIIDNHSAFGRARVALASFKTYQEAQNFFKYAQTYIVRFMFLMTDEALTSLGKRVPDLMDYSDANILVDFNADLNKQLYDLMELTEEEIIHIENTVNNLRKSRKEMT